MKILSLTTIVASVFFLSSCGGSNADVTEQQVDSQEEVTPTHSDELQLNKGEKWKVNTEMLPFIIESENHVKNFDGSDIDSLLVTLKSLNTQLISSCTMTGEAHDELHKWLHPHLSLIKEMTAETSLEVKNQKLEKLEESFQIFHVFFE